MCVGAVHDVVAVLSSLGIHFGGGSVGDQEVAKCTQAASATTMPDAATPEQTSQPTKWTMEGGRWSVKRNAPPDAGSSGESTAGETIADSSSDSKSDGVASENFEGSSFDGAGEDAGTLAGHSDALQCKLQTAKEADAPPASSAVQKRAKNRKKKSSVGPEKILQRATSCGEPTAMPDASGSDELRHASSDSSSTDDAPPDAEDKAPPPAAGDAAAPPVAEASPAVEPTAGDVDKPFENGCIRAARTKNKKKKSNVGSDKILQRAASCGESTAMPDALGSDELRHATSDSSSTDDAPPDAEDKVPPPAAGDAAAPPVAEASPAVEPTAGDVDKPFENGCARAELSHATSDSMHRAVTWAVPLVAEDSATPPVAQHAAPPPFDKLLLADEIADLITAAFRDRRDIDILPQLHQCLEAASQLNETCLVECAQQAIALVQRR